MGFGDYRLYFNLVDGFFFSILPFGNQPEPDPGEGHAEKRASKTTNCFQDACNDRYCNSTFWRSMVDNWI